VPFFLFADDFSWVVFPFYVLQYDWLLNWTVFWERKWTSRKFEILLKKKTLTGLKSSTNEKTLKILYHGFYILTEYLYTDLSFWLTQTILL